MLLRFLMLIRNETQKPQTARLFVVTPAFEFSLFFPSPFSLCPVFSFMFRRNQRVDLRISTPKSLGFRLRRCVKQKQTKKIAKDIAVIPSCDMIIEAREELCLVCRHGKPSVYYRKHH